MDGQAWCAVAVAGVAAGWLAIRWWSHGFDDDVHDCSGCGVAKPHAKKRAGLPHAPVAHGKPVGIESNGRAVRGP